MAARVAWGSVMKWMQERDLLIAQTMAFVQSVKGHQPEADIFARADLPAVTPTRLPDLQALLAEGISPAETPKPVPSAPKPPVRTGGRSQYQNDIQARVEKFRAHQARFKREREAYFSATMAKLQASLDKYPVPRSK